MKARTKTRILSRHTRRTHQDPAVLSHAKLLADDTAEWIKLLGLLGFSGATIAHETQTRLWKVWRILAAEGISLRSYRRGESPIAQYVIQRTYQAGHLPVNLQLNRQLLLK